MKNPKTRICVYNTHNQLHIYIDISGTHYFLTFRRRCGLLYKWLKDGISVGELVRVKPSPKSKSQKIYHYAQHLRKIIEEYFNNNQMAAWLPIEEDLPNV